MGQKNRTDSKLFDAINGNQKQFEDIWEPTPEYTHYTVYSLKEYFIAFIIFVAIHPFLIFAVKKKFSGGFETTRNFYEKIHHILTQLYVPSTFKDWDEYEITSELFYIVRGKSEEPPSGSVRRKHTIRWQHHLPEIYLSRPKQPPISILVNEGALCCLNESI